MINAAETQPPRASINQVLNPGETVAPESSIQTGQSTVLLTGESIAESYVVNSLLNKQGKQANVYLAKKWGKTFVIKVYHNGWHPSNQMQSFLTSVRHPNIASVVESGEYEGSYYEIYEYYSEGTLEDDGPLSSTFIQNVLVPSINEGLNELHRNGIVHCDIKPSNLFYTDEHKRIVIGDCGISGYTNSNGKLVDAVRGTPEYAPRVKALLWSAAMSPAYDYGSFGLVLCKAVLGHSLFAGMSVEEISRAWETGIELPSQINGRIAILLKGLINEDEDQRWGYSEVKRWCEGEYMRPTNRNIYMRTQKNVEKKPLIFGRFDGQTISVNTLHQLEFAIREHWVQATHVIKRRELVEFVRQFDNSLSDKIKDLAMYQDTDAAVFRLLMYIADDKKSIYYCGVKYESLRDYVERLVSGKDEKAIRFLQTGLLVFYLRLNDFEQTEVDRVERLIRRSGSDDMSAITTICYALQGKKDVDVYGISVDSLDALIPILAKCTIKDIDALLHDDRFIAWLNRMGYEKEVRKMKEV